MPPDLVVPSVTTILAEYSKPWLGPWMVNEAGRFTADNLDFLAGLDRDAVADVVARASKRSSSGSMSRGTEIHEGIESGTPSSDLPQIAAALDFIETCTAFDHYKEATIFSETYQYAGTCDRIVALADVERVPAELRGKSVVVDWKSGKRIYPEVALQLSAYANGDFIVDPDTMEAQELPPIEAGVVVHLTDEGKWKAMTVNLTPDLFKAFVALRTLTKFRSYVEPDVLTAWEKTAV